MKKLILLLIVVITVIILMFKLGPQPILLGSYQVERVDGYTIQFVFQPEENSFVQYIDSREVDRGTFQLKKDNIYELKSDKQHKELILNRENSFDIVIGKINQGEPVRLINVSSIPMYSSTKFDDVEEYQKLIEEN